MCVCERERRRARERETCCVVCLHLSFPFLIQLDCFFSDLIKNFLVREREVNSTYTEPVIVLVRKMSDCNDDNEAHTVGSEGRCPTRPLLCRLMPVMTPT